jgi:hypothetical protein
LLKKKKKKMKQKLTGLLPLQPMKLNKITGFFFEPLLEILIFRAFFMKVV